MSTVTRWTATNIKPSVVGGFVAYGDYQELAAEVERLRDLLAKIGRIPGVADRAGVGDGSVHDAVVALYGSSVTDEALLRQALEALTCAQWVDLPKEWEQLTDSTVAALRERLGEKA